ncbi:hypothetical protein [Streptomyces bohaiensis]|uniref:hypothetical protein n=1 Tax=Streptomyces bohaiensis TaxID=1431344 RepID=UPI003B7CCA3E
MSRGGARTVSGPPPDPNALRRDRKGDQAGWTTLPADGRSGPPPAWPLTEQTNREVGLWCDLWSRPQAVMWERLRQEFEVALAVRTLAIAEDPEASTERVKVARQHLDSLGLTVQGMLRNRWKIGAVTAPEVDADDQGDEEPARLSVRDRMKVIEGGR